MAYGEEDLLPISALQHLAFCERQCALIHVERLWADNDRTAEGHELHAKVDEGYKAYRKGLKQFSGVQVHSLELGIAGRLDVVELTKQEAGPDNCLFLRIAGHWTIAPVEFKRGKVKKHDADSVQLCAQALCLEEMTGCLVPTGSLFYAQTRRRTEIALDESLRQRTKQLILRHREIVSQNLLPGPVVKRHCKSCSLVDLCQPRLTNGARTSEYERELFG